jgi:hypothetical protein
MTGVIIGANELTGGEMLCANAGTALKAPTVTPHRAASFLSKLVLTVDLLSIVLLNVFYSQMVRRCSILSENRPVEM